MDAFRPVKRLWREVRKARRRTRREGREAGLRLTSRLHRSCRGRELGSGEGNYIRTRETGHIFG